MSSSFAPGALVCVVVVMCARADVTTHAVSQDMEAKVKQLLLEIIKIEHYQSISSDNSQVIVRTAAIKKITDGGVDNLDVLINAMKTDISFDAFVRCYSACDQILQKIYPQQRAYWNGGSQHERIGEFDRFIPGRIKDEKSFRRRVIEDIEKKRKNL